MQSGGPSVQVKTGTKSKPPQGPKWKEVVKAQSDFLDYVILLISNYPIPFPYFRKFEKRVNKNNSNFEVWKRGSESQLHEPLLGSLAANAKSKCNPLET